MRDMGLFAKRLDAVRRRTGTHVLTCRWHTSRNRCDRGRRRNRGQVLTFNFWRRGFAAFRDVSTGTFDRRRAAWESVVEVYRDVLGRDDLVPGLIAGIQTFGELVPFHPHVQAIATDGGFLPNGTFVCLDSHSNAEEVTIDRSAVNAQKSAAVGPRPRTTVRPGIGLRPASLQRPRRSRQKHIALASVTKHPQATARNIPE